MIAQKWPRFTVSVFRAGLVDGHHRRVGYAVRKVVIHVFNV